MGYQKLGDKMNICVQGLWHLGSVTAACLASVGYNIIGLDEDTKNIKKLNNGIAPVYEPGLNELIKSEINNGRLSFTTSQKIALADTNVLWVTFDTPVDNQDKADVELIQSKIKMTIPFLNDDTIVIISSQMPVGSVRKLEDFVKNKNVKKKLSFAYIPENLRLGKAIDVFLKPDRFVIGVRDEYSKNFLQNLISPITDKVQWMTVESSEMSKHAINAFLATSITFANEIAAICELVGADAKEVERGLKTESRIGPKAYLSPGGPFAGGTLARDIAFLNKQSQKHKLKTPLISAVRVSNDEHKKWIQRKLVQEFNDLSRITVAIWGLTYKPGTNTLRRSLALELCYWLVNQGTSINIYDPVIKKMPKQLLNKVNQVKNALDVIKHADALIVGTDWPEFKQVVSKLATKVKSSFVIIDPNRHLQANINEYEFKYYAVGTPLKERI